MIRTAPTSITAAECLPRIMSLETIAAPSARRLAVLGSPHPGNACRSAVERGDPLVGRTSPKRAQGELHHEGVIFRQAATISIISNVVQGQDEAVVDISDPELSLAHLAGQEVIAGSAK